MSVVGGEMCVCVCGADQVRGVCGVICIFVAQLPCGSMRLSL